MSASQPALTLGDAPRSGLGDRFAAWLSLFTLAKLRGTSALLLQSAWGRGVYSQQASQSEDVQAALDCFLLPRHVLRNASGVEVEAVYFFAAKRAFFKRGVVHHHPVPGFPQVHWTSRTLCSLLLAPCSLLPFALTRPTVELSRGQWAVPELAAGAFAKVDPHLANLSIAQYIQVMRVVASEVV